MTLLKSRVISAFRRLAWSVAIAGLTASCAAGWLQHEGYILNVTPSLPVGIYKLAALPPSLADGALVELCPLSASASPAMRQAIDRAWMIYTVSTPCADHLAPFLKRIAAVPGDVVDLSAEGIAVDGRLLPATRIQPVSKVGVTMIHFPVGRYIVKPGTVWVTDNSSPWAYDSRYFGPVPASHVISGLRPVLTW